MIMLCLVTATFLMKRLNAYLKLDTEEIRDGKLVYHPPLELTKSGKPFDDVDVAAVRRLISPIQPITNEEIDYNKMRFVVVTAATAGYFMHLRKLVETAQNFVGTAIMVYDLGLRRKQAIKVRDFDTTCFASFDARCTCVT